MELKLELEKHLNVLCRQIGTRYSGSPQERRAAEYIAEQLASLGLNPEIRPFAFPNWKPGRIKATLITNGTEAPIPGVGPLIYSSRTPREGVTGELVYIESLQPASFPATGLEDKIGLLIGAHDLGDPSTAGRIMASGLAGLITVDERLPFPWRVPIGMAPQWAETFTLPAVALPYLQAVKLEKRIPGRVRLEIDAWIGTSESTNVIAEIEGSETPDEIIVVSAHLDTVPFNEGADDNASGCAFLLETVRILKDIRPSRTVRFIAYGVEEKLSVGAYLYMRSLSPRERAKIFFLLNADSLAARIGRNTALCTGTPAMTDYFERALRRRSFDSAVKTEANPFSDHFPLNICGVPSVWATRLNLFEASYWMLHSRHDRIENISLDVLENTTRVYADILGELGTVKGFPFPRKITAALKNKVDDLAVRLYRHPWKPVL